MHKNNVLRTFQLPRPSILRGGVFYFPSIPYNDHMNILQTIFADHYEEILYTCHPRPVEIENIDKMINCGDPAFGGAMYACTHCGFLKFVPFRCHSRFCPTCGNLYSRKRATAMIGKLVRCNHRHCVFTIPEELRHFFLEDRKLLNCLFSAVWSVISRMFFNLNKSKNFVPGVICVLHTFGRPLEWNPHIHCLISEGGYSDDGYWRHVKHFNYTYLRNAFRTALLDAMETAIGPSFKRAKADMYRLHAQGFYVYAKPNLSDPKTVVEYIGRYLGRPVIATSRIDSYDPTADTVTFHYNRHEDDMFIRKTIPALDFIRLLIQHIPEKNFKMIRYYGLYARHREFDSKLVRFRTREQHRYMMRFNEWRNAILVSFGYDPLQCPHCKKEMSFVELFYDHKRVSLDELYERANTKYRARHWHSSA